MPRPALKYVPLDTAPPAEESPFWGGALRVEEAAREFGFNVRTLFRLMERNEVAWSRVGKRTRVIARRDLVAYLERQRGV